ncbi:MAG: hypothetical protein COB17_07390 [Sulfurimonas sp.]|nr:MAG: hypothetical protein COB17_07390 [Sulfurimonas sp.]
MLNITDLENRHKKYKIKTYIPKLIAFLSIIILSILFITVFKPKEKKIIQPQVVQLQVIKKENIQNLKALIPKKNINTQQLVLYPSFKFLQDLKFDDLKKEKTKQTAKFQKDILQNKKIIDINKNMQIALEKKNEIKIKRQNTNKDIEHVLKRFENNNNPALSLFVAKKYYELGFYDKSYNYALITNNINSEIDDSWIIFTKSLVKLNQKNKALKILKAYIKQSHSSEAKILLNDILSGKFNES